MFDVIDTEKYVGIVIEFAAGEAIYDENRDEARANVQVANCLNTFWPADTCGTGTRPSSLPSSFPVWTICIRKASFTVISSSKTSCSTSTEISS